MSLILNKNIGAGEVVIDAITDGVTNKASSSNAIFDALALKISSSEKGANNGVATLDAGGKIPASQLPNSVMEYKGLWDASSNSPSLADGTGNAGDVYRVSAAGSVDFGSGSISFAIGDYVIYSGSIWQKADMTDAVASVNGQTGVVVLTTSDISEGSNLYYTAARFNSAFSGKSTTDLAEGSNLYYTAARFNSAFSAKSTSDLSEGSNLYFTEARVRGSVLTGFSAGSGNETVAASDSVLQAFQKLAGNSIEIDGNANDLITLSGVAENATHLGTFTGTTIPDSSTIKGALQSLETFAEGISGSFAVWGKETFVLSGTNITNQYVDLAQVVKASSVDFMFSGLIHEEGVSYSVSLTGGAGGKTRISFLGDLATAGASALVASDRIVIKYQY